MSRPILLFLLILFAATGEVLACSCMENATVDIELAKTDNVAIFRVRSVQNSGIPAEPALFTNRIADLSVEKVFKGNFKPGQTVRFQASVITSCDWGFGEDSIGREFLLYLPAKPGHGGLWRVVSCTRSASVEDAAADILYLRRMKQNAGKSRLSGLVKRTISTPIETERYITERLSGQKVVITGEGKRIELKTDKNGVYEIYDLPPGKYRVRPEAVAGYIYDIGGKDAGIEVEIKRGKHTEQEIGFWIHNSIQGRLSDPAGNPLKDVCLKLLPVESVNPKYYPTSVLTKGDGSFNLEGSPAGRYVLAINDEETITAAAPFPVFYYPNVKNRKDAAEIQLAPGTVIENLEIVAPDAAEVITVSGTVRMEDGKPANEENTQRAEVVFESDAKKHYLDSKASIDSEGRFTIRILKGQTGRLVGSMLTYLGKYTDCPKFDGLFPIKGEQVGEVETSAFRITADENKVGIELTFPFPTCKMVKSEW